MEDPLPITTQEERLVYQNRFVDVYDNPVTFFGGSGGSYLRIIESGGLPGVAVLALASGEVALIRTYRYPISAWEWGIPRGFAHASDPRASALSELAEELGGEPEQLTELGMMTPNSGLLASVVHLFVARYPVPIAEPTDRHEVAEVRWIPVAGLLREIAEGRITDGFTLAAVGCAASHGLFGTSR